MPFREKVAWISLLTLLGVFGAFFGAILTGRLASRGIETLHYLLISIIAVVVLQVVLRIAAALLARADAGTPKDERERLIELKATRLAFGVLIPALLGGVFAVAHGPLVGLPQFGIPEVGLTVLAAIILAEVVRAAATIAHYRLGF